MKHTALWYLTHCLVNYTTLQQWGDRFHIITQQAFIKDSIPDDEAAGLLIDLDCFGPEERDRLMKWMLAAARRYPVAVHSYQLDDHQIATLERVGVLVFRRLEAKAVLMLANGRAGTGGTAA